MEEQTTEVIIKNKIGKIVERAHLKDFILDGTCEWYDGSGNLVAYGFFENGSPLAGTFLNWTKFFTNLDKEKPYDSRIYCQDWITEFEMSFMSEYPKYEMLIEAYCNGRMILAAKEKNNSYE